MALLVDSNIAVKCAIHSQPKEKTCKSGLECLKYCYNNKALRIYKAVKPADDKNHEISLQENFVDLMNKEVKKSKYNFVRIHERGDFYSIAYIYKWYQIAKDNPEKVFYAYTKRDDLFTENIIKDKPKNFVLIYSIDGIKTKEQIKQLKGFIDFQLAIGYDKVTIVSDKENTCLKIKHDNVYCMANCFNCLNPKIKTIIFKKH